MTTARKNIKLMTYVVTVILVVLLGVEFALRFLGFQTQQELRGVFIDCEPEDHMTIPHPVMGFKPKPGSFECSLEEALKFNITHWQDSSRATSTTPAAGNTEKKAEIFLLGGSFTWGHGLGDSATFGWKLQTLLPEMTVRNFGIGASSTVQAYLRLQQLINAGEKPGVVILNYASFHDMRNTFSRQWSNIWHSIISQSKGRISESRRNQVISELSFPYARRRSDGSIGIDYLPAKNLAAPLAYRDRLVSINMLDTILNRYDENRKKSQAVTLGLIEAIVRLCHHNGIEFVLTALTSDAGTTRVLDYFRQRHIVTANISVDISQKQFNLMPYDFHPNERAHEQYAGKIYELLVAHRLVP